MYGLIAGLHSFRFKESQSGQATLFRHTEEYSGPIAFLMTPSLIGRGMVKKMERFNLNLKARAESLS